MQKQKHFNLRKLWLSLLLLVGATAVAVPGIQEIAEDDVIEISSVEQLKAFRDAVNNKTSYAGKIVKLTADLDLSGESNWEPIGDVASYPSKAFSGTFDGGNHTISNLTVDDQTVNWGRAGLFGSVTNGTIKDLTISNVNIKSHHYAGGIVAYKGDNTNVTISNCHVSNGSIVSTPELLSNGSYDNGDKVGGIAGYCSSPITIEDCSVEDINISGYRDLGGIGGYINGTVKNCSVTSVTISQDNSHDYKNADQLFTVGQIVGGRSSESAMTETTNTATDVTIKQTGLGVAMIGETWYQTIADAVNAATEGQTINVVEAGDYTLPSLSKNVTIEGTVDGVVFNHTTSGSVASIPYGASFKNVTFNFGNNNYHGFQHAGTINMDGCTLNGKLFSYGDMNFTDCSFNQSNSDYHMWAYSGNLTYTDCTFTNEKTGKFINVYNESGTTKYTVTVDNCKFVNQASSSKAALNVKATSGSNLLAYDVIINNCTTEGAFPEASTSDALVVLNSVVQVDDRPASGVDNITVTQDGVLIYPAAVAKIGDVQYPTLQSALNAAHEMTGDVTITLLEDISDYAIVHQKEGLNLTIDGAQKKMSSNIVIDGDGRASGTETLTIKNIKFEGDGTNFCSGTSSFVEVPSTKTAGTPFYTNKYNYAHNVTIDNCSFTSTTSGLTMAAIRATSGAGLYNVTINNSTGTNLHSLAQLTGTTGGTVTNCTVTGSESFVNVSGGTGDFTVSGNTFTSAEGADGYGIRENGTSTAVITLTDNTFTAASAVVLGKGDSQTAGTINVESGIYTGSISKTEAATGKIVVSGGYFSEEVAQDYIVEGKVCVSATDKPGFFTLGDPHYVAQIGETKYVSLQAAVDAAYEMSGDVTIELIDNIEGYSIVKQKAGLNLTIDGAEKTVAGQIIIDGDGGSSRTETLVIKKINFEGNSTNFCSGTDAFILVPSTNTAGTPYYNQPSNNYAHNVTVTDCSFTSTSTGFDVVGVKSNSKAAIYNVVITNNTGTNLHSLAQLTAPTNGTITNNTVDNSESFVNVSGGGGEFTVSGNTFSSAEGADGYGIRENSGSSAIITLTDNTFTAPTAVKLGKSASATNGTINVVSGTYVGDIVKDIAATATGKIVISGGQFSVDLTDTTYEPFIAEGKIGVQNDAVEGAPYSVENGTYVAQVTLGETTHKYGSLEAAFAAAADGSTVKLLDDCAGNGIKVPQGKYTTGLTVDFDGHTYTMDGAMVGSTGTETQAFQLLKDNTITFKNGTITSTKAKILVQNYSNLTLEGMTLTLDNPDYASAYTLSNNNGNVVIDGTTINANPAGGFAFDVCRYSSYPSVSVTVKGESVINGDVEVSASGNDAKDGFSLMLESGTINGNIVVDASARAAIEATPDKAVIKENDSFNQAAPAGFKWVSNNDETSTLTPMPYVAQIGDVKYWSLADAVAAVPADGTETTITMIDNEMINVVGYAITIPATKNIVLDLNGYQVVGTVEQEGTSALIRNLGTLTIKDSSDTNKDGTGTGKLMSGANTTWTWDGTDNYAGSYASNLIRNEKNLTVESGYLYNMSTGSAAYAIDNYSAGNVTINGGKLDAAKASAIRMFYVNGGSITVNDGIVGSSTAYMGVQVMGGTNVNVSINGGTISGTYSVYSNATGGSTSITGGTYDGYVGFAASVPNISITDGTFGAWVGTWGDQTKFISGGIYAEEVDEEYIADGCILTNNTDPATKDAYPYMVKQGKFVCAIGTTKYETLAEAVAAAGTAETTITLLTEAATEGVISGNGVVVPSGSNITFDLNGLTYDVSGETVGSTNTKTSGFQLLQGSNITFKNGTLKATSPTAQMLIQNYSNLTLEDVNLDGTGLSGWAYALSNNCGTINLTGSTSITAKSGGRAFDTCKFGSYAIPTVNINTTGTITGPIEATGGKLNIENGQFNVTWVTDNNYTAGDIQITGGIFTAEPAEEYCAEGYIVTDNEDDETKATYPYAVMSKEDAGIFELVDGKIYPYLDYTEDKVAASVTYKREFKNNDWQALFIPFDINDITELTDRYEFAKIHMVALENDGTFTTGNKIEIYYTRITSGKISANQPYLIKAKNTGWQDIVVENTILKDTHNMTPRKTSTMAADYIFTGTYEGYVGQKYHDFMAMGKGTINWGNTGHSVGTYRWYIKTEPFNDDYAKATISFIEADEDATSISTVDSNEEAEIEGYYSVNGVRSDVPVKGMNIVKYKNGKTKKIMIK